MILVLSIPGAGLPRCSDAALESCLSDVAALAAAQYFRLPTSQMCLTRQPSGTPQSTLLPKQPMFRCTLQAAH